MTALTHVWGYDFDAHVGAYEAWEWSRSQVVCGYCGTVFTDEVELQAHLDSYA